LHVYGSANLIQTFMKHDLMDAIWLKIFPVTLSGGKRLFCRCHDPGGIQGDGKYSQLEGRDSSELRAGGKYQLEAYKYSAWVARPFDLAGIANTVGMGARKDR
jgi:dihydrofolate reductase